MTRSLALLSDAADVLLDMLALGMSYVALRLAARPADDRHTYGYHRFEVLAALANGSLLFLMAVGIFREAWRRFQAPEPVLALVVAVIGLGVNLVVMRVLGEHDHRDRQRPQRVAARVGRHVVVGWGHRRRPDHPAHRVDAG